MGFLVQADNDNFFSSIDGYREALGAQFASKGDGTRNGIRNVGARQAQAHHLSHHGHRKKDCVFSWHQKLLDSASWLTQYGDDLDDIAFEHRIHETRKDLRYDGYGLIFVPTLDDLHAANDRRLEAA